MRYPIYRRMVVVLIIWFLTSVIFGSFPTEPGNRAAQAFYAADIPQKSSVAPPDFFGMVGRDPWYDFNSDPTNPNRPNLAMQENMAQQISLAGARWVRIEFHADARSDARGGFIDYSKIDVFINEIAPRYGLKVLALVGADLVIAKNPNDTDLAYTRLNDNPDQPDGSNPYIRAFAGRVKELSDRYGDKIGAYEILNEANNWYGFKAKAENIGALMSLIYAGVKTSHPNVKIILGGTIATGDPYLDHVSYLSDIYKSKTVQNYKERGPHFGDNPFPFDGVAWHPYFTDAWDSLYTVDQAITLMRQAGDKTNKLWVTETGLAGARDNRNCAGPQTTNEDDEQAQYLRIFYSYAAQRQADVGAVFWFKFEDFYVNGQIIPMGLVHLSVNQNGYSPHGGKIVRYKPAYAAFQKLALPNLPADAIQPPAIQNSAANPNAPYYFRETGHTLSGPFLNYWLKNGGADLFGLPLTEPYPEIDPGTGKAFTVQWFERERFEYHPENAGSKYEVLLGLLGNELIARACRSFERAQSLVPPPMPTPIPPTPEKGKPTATPVPTPKPDRLYFRETGHNLRGVFKTYWENRGGLAIFGYPTSEEFGETNPADGKFYTVQYFERARFEYHPEHNGTPYEVQLGLLGSQALAARFWK